MPENALQYAPADHDAVNPIQAAQKRGRQYKKAAQNAYRCLRQGLAARRVEWGELDIDKRLGLYVNVLIFLAAAFAVCFTLSQLKIARDTLIASDRGWVIPIWDTVGFRFSPDKWIRNEVRVKNWGGGIAKDVWGCGKIVPSARDHSDPPPAPPCLLDQKGSRGLMAPGGEFTVSFQLEPIGADALAAVPKGEQTLFVFGVIHYADTFSDDRETTYCMWYEHDPEKTRRQAETAPNDPSAITQGRWILCPRGTAAR